MLERRWHLEFFNLSRWIAGMGLFLTAWALAGEESQGGAPAGDDPIRILFFGDSLTAGYGIDPDQAYPALLAEKLRKAGYRTDVTVGAVSGDTSAGGLRRINWMLRQPVDVFILALGANDGLRGVDPGATESNLQNILTRVRERFPDAILVIAGMRIPPSMGKDYAEEFASIYPRLSEANEASLIPFLLEGVGGRPELNLADRIHPNPAGHQILAENVWQILEPLLASSAEPDPE